MAAEPNPEVSGTQTVFRVREYEAVDVPLSDLIGEDESELAINPGVSGRDYFDLRLRGKALCVTARGFIGLIALNSSVAIEVVPRVPIANLAHLLTAGGFAPQTLESAARTYDVATDELPSLRDFFATALLDALGPIETQGKLLEYQQHRSRTSAPRGRVLLNSTETMRALKGGSTTIQAAWFERTADAAANRCLKLAIWLLGIEYGRAGRLTPVQRSLARRLNWSYSMFDAVALDTRMECMSDPVVRGDRPPPTNRSYYEQSLAIARTVVSRSSVVLDRRGHGLRAPSVVLSLQDVFEDYVRLVIAKELSARAPESQLKMETTRERRTCLTRSLPRMRRPMSYSAESRPRRLR